MVGRGRIALGDHEKLDFDGDEGVRGLRIELLALPRDQGPFHLLV